MSPAWPLTASWETDQTHRCESLGIGAPWQKKFTGVQEKKHEGTNDAHDDESSRLRGVVVTASFSRGSYLLCHDMSHRPVGPPSRCATLSSTPLLQLLNQCLRESTERFGHREGVDHNLKLTSPSEAFPYGNSPYRYSYGPIVAPQWHITYQ